MDEEAKFLDKSVHEGFPNAALDSSSKSLSLDSLLLNKPASIFLMRAVGDTLNSRGIIDKDILVVDKSLTPKHGDVVVCQIDGHFKLREVKLKNQQVLLVSSDDSKIADQEDIIWGVVKASVTQFN